MCCLLFCFGRTVLGKLTFIFVIEKVLKNCRVTANRCLNLFPTTFCVTPGLVLPARENIFELNQIVSNVKIPLLSARVLGVEGSAQYLSCSQDCVPLDADLRCCSWDLLLQSPRRPMMPLLPTSSPAPLSAFGISRPSRVPSP